MIHAFILCAQVATGGWGCLPITDGIACQQVEALLHQSVVVESDCSQVEIAPGTIYAPATSPMPPLPQRVKP